MTGVTRVAPLSSQTLTFLFSDLRDYTRYVERFGDAAATALIGDYRRIVRAEVAKAAGAEIKTEGDSFYVVFTSARAAVTCALGIVREADRYSRDRSDRAMKVGVGIHAGEPMPHEGQYVGAAVILAARLAQAAGPGEVLVTDVVRALLPRDGAPGMDERAGLQLKGIADPPRVFAVRRAAEASDVASTKGEVAIPAAQPRSRQLLCPEVIGRGADLATLESQLDEASSGRGRTVLVAGEAGLGKSALLRRFAARAAARGARVLVGECSEIEARRPFGPVIDAFRAAELPLPEELSQGAPGAQPAAETERYRVHSGFATRLAATSGASPLVLVVEDLHWGDEATHELIPYLARKLRDSAVLIVATYRTDELHRTHPLNHVLAELARGRLAEEIRLRPLTRDEIGDMVKLALSLDRPTTREFSDALFERTEGNPFFIEEILRALVERGELAYRDGSWRRTKSVAELTIPVSVRDAVQQRLLTLPADDRSVIQIAAVIGQRFEFDLLREVSGLREDAVFDAIRSAIDAQLLSEEPEAEQESYRFRHALSRESVLADMLARERRLLHKRVGEAIEHHAPGRSEDLAYHFDEARDPRAFRYLAAAGEEAAASFAFGRAVHHFDRAIELAPDDAAGIGALYLGLARASFLSGDPHRGARAAEGAVAAYRAAGDDEGGAEATVALAAIRWHLGDTARARALADEAVATLEPRGPGRALARALAEVARLGSLGTDDVGAVIGVAERAAAMARGLGDRGTEADALISIGTAMSREAQAGASDAIRRALDLVAETGPVDTAARAYNNLSATLFREDAPQEEIDRVMDAALAHAQRYGYRSDTLLFREAARATFRLDWDRALAIVEEGELDTPWGAGRELLRATILTFRNGPDPDVRTGAEAAADRLRATGSPQFVWGSLFRLVIRGLAGDHAAAAHPDAFPILEAHATALAGGDGLPIAAAIASTHAVRDRPALDRWEALLARHFGASSAGALLARALAARADGDDDDALAALRGIGAVRTRPIAFYLHSIAAQHVAEILATRGDGDGARAAADAAREPFRTARATWYLDVLDRWSHDLGIG